MRTWVTAATCSARFSCRLPRGLSRCRCLGFDEAFIGGDELVVEPANVARQLERDPLAFDLDPLEGPPARREARGEVGAAGRAGVGPR